MFRKLWIAALCSGLALFVPFVFVVPYAKDRGVSASAAAWLVGLLGGSSVISRIAFGSLSRRFGRPLVVKLIGQKSMAQLDDLVRRGGAPFFFLIWLLPGAPDDLACVAAGLTPMPTRQFMILMLVGRLPGVFMSVLFGAHVTEIRRELWIAIFAGIAIVALVVWRWGDAIQEAIVSFVERLSQRLKR